MMKYYQKKLFLAQVDKNDNIVGKIERWQAHKKGVLHRGFTAIMTYRDNIILQHRKHLAFDDCFDLTFSSHQIYKNEKLQSDTEAIYEALKREWNIDKTGLTKEPKFLGKFYYLAKDPGSEYIEHEIDYIYQVELKNPPTPNLNFAYGFSSMTKERILNSRKVTLGINPYFAPWVKKITEIIK